jgi:hypothetical protein
MKFGFGQVLNPTPAQAKRFFHSFFTITSVVAMALQCFPQIPQHVNDVVNQWVVSSNTFVFGLTRLFGIDEKPSNFPNNAQL